jgi:hypothetical protein
MSVLGAISAWAGMLLATGNGWSPLVFLGCGLFVGLLLEASVVRRLAKRWRARLFSLCFIGILSLVLAKCSTGTNPSAAFRAAAGIETPRGVSNLHAWQQWYDGRNLVLEFDADQASIDAVLANRGHTYGRQDFLEKELLRKPDEQLALVQQVILPPFFDDRRLHFKQMSQPQVWEESSQEHDFTLLWDPPTQQAIMKCWGPIGG